MLGVELLEEEAAPEFLRGAFPSKRSERPQDRKRNHSHGSEMDTSHINKVKTPQHDGTPRSYDVDLPREARVAVVGLDVRRRFLKTSPFGQGLSPTFFIGGARVERDEVAAETALFADRAVGQSRTKGRQVQGPGVLGGHGVPVRF